MRMLSFVLDVRTRSCIYRTSKFERAQTLLTQLSFGTLLLAPITNVYISKSRSLDWRVASNEIAYARVCLCLDDAVVSDEPVAARHLGAAVKCASSCWSWLAFFLGVGP